MANLTEDPTDSTDVFAPDERPSDDEMDAEQIQPAFRIYEGSKIVVGKTVGPSWRKKYESALATYEQTHLIWDEVFRYYNNHQSKSQQTVQGVFKRGDSTENMIYSNLNVMLPATYSKDPHFSCSTTDQADEKFCNTLQDVINTLMRRKDKLGAKQKIKRAAGFALLTNFGVLKLEWTRKDDSREIAQQEMARIMEAMARTKKQEELDMLYGQLEALEHNMEVRKPSGPGLCNVLPQNLIIDPNAEQTDCMDAQWMIERTMLSTNYLNAQFAKPDPETEGTDSAARVLVYKPTHKAVFQGGEGERDEGLGIVMKAIESNATVTSHTEEERTAYIEMYYTECFYVWDRATYRVMLFAADDWTWPVWVWDAADLLRVTRFFPYFVIGFGFSSGGSVTVGEVAYILDQQDEINQINRQIAKIRRTVFNYFYYNSNKINKDDAEKFLKALMSPSDDGEHFLAVKAGDHKIADLIEAVKPPAVDYEALFAKDPIKQAMDRVTNTNDALRGVQFKAYTNESAVESYQESLRLSIGAKVDIIEDTVADLAIALAEMCVQHLSPQEVAGLVGEAKAAEWKEMPLEIFNSQYTLQLVAGSMEKPNSVFKKREAIQAAQAIGQFAQAAPGTTLWIMLDLFQKAFTDITIKPEQWDMMRKEIAASMQQGVSTGQQVGGVPGAPGDPAAAGAAPGGGGQIEQILMQLPAEAKQKLMQMRQQGVPAEQIIQFAVQAAQQAGIMPGQAQGTPPAAGASSESPASNVAQQQNGSAARPY